MTARKSGSFNPIPLTETEKEMETTSSDAKKGDSYIFFDPDTKNNIVRFDNQKPDLHSFKTTKGATLGKIIEKITLKESSGMLYYDLYFTLTLYLNTSFIVNKSTN